MATEGATLITDLNAAAPTGQGAISDGDDEFRQLKTVLQNQFPNMGNAQVTASATELSQVAGANSNLQDQLDVLDDRNQMLQLPTAARDFSNSWWSQSGGDDQHVWYMDVATYADFSWVPWPWGDGIAEWPGRNPTDQLGLIIQKYVNNTKQLAYHRVLAISDNIGISNNSMFEYYRGAFSGAQIMLDDWGRLTVASVSVGVTGGSNSGIATFATAKGEIEQANPGCDVCN